MDYTPTVVVNTLSTAVRGRTFARAWSQTRRLLPLVPLLLIFVVTELRGLDFGTHWDEVDWQVQPVQNMVATGLLMPHADIYPAFAKWLVFLPALVRGIETALAVGLHPDLIQAAMRRTVDAPDYLLTARAVFVVASALSLVWVYAAALVLGKRPWEALVAAATLGLSWQFAYHARWVATDCIVVQFTALTLLLLVAFLRRRRTSYLYGAAVTVGLTIGTKFPAAPLLLPVLVCGAARLPRFRIRAQIERAVGLGGTAFLAYLVTTPATVFEPFSFVDKLQFISSHYEAGHYGFSVVPGWEHLYKVLLYFAVSYFSPYQWVSVLLAAGVVAGGVVAFRRDRPVAALLVGFPVLFLIFFCFRYSALIVRNYLLLAPFFALLLVFALGALVDALKTFWLRALVFAGLGLVAAANGVFLVTSAESIRHPDLDADVKRAVDYARARPQARFRWSPHVSAIARARHWPLPKDAATAGFDHVVFVAPEEGPNPFDWPANDPWMAERVFGPADIDMNWYPTWMGDKHVLVTTRAKALHIGVPFLR